MSRPMPAKSATLRVATDISGMGRINSETTFVSRTNIVV